MRLDFSHPDSYEGCLWLLAKHSIYPDGPDSDPFDNPNDFMPKTYTKTSASARKRRKTTVTTPDPPTEPEEPAPATEHEAFVVEISSSPPDMAEHAPTSDEPDTDAVAGAPPNTPAPVTSAEQPGEPMMVPLGATDPGPATQMRTDAELTAYIASQTLSCM